MKKLCRCPEVSAKRYWHRMERHMDDIMNSIQTLCAQHARGPEGARVNAVSNEVLLSISQKTSMETVNQLLGMIVDGRIEPEELTAEMSPDSLQALLKQKLDNDSERFLNGHGGLA